MSKSLGIFVSSDRHLDKIIKLCRAAKKNAVTVHIFLTHTGTLLTQEDRLKELAELADLSLCKVTFNGHGLKPPVPGLREKDFATQARHADLITDCDRYLVF